MLHFLTIKLCLKKGIVDSLNIYNQTFYRNSLAQPIPILSTNFIGIPFLFQFYNLWV